MSFTKYIVAILLLVFTAVNFAAEPKNLKSGWFTAYNDTNHEITIAVGNWFPTTYTIGPHNYRYVSVSTDNQNIHITSVR